MREQYLKPTELKRGVRCSYTSPNCIIGIRRLGLTIDPAKILYSRRAGVSGREMVKNVLSRWAQNPGAASRSREPQKGNF
jgi:hypothetical protein